ncbi:hypothetical protein JYB87_11020 [Shewanella avicenniae]|uniref:Uncharacterized protein n=1 Tax=Shewanella avicenniae TaxID=2814294 RepID=A0ABX7QMV1_9GAMM|nr:hypothetical protein [Shewanella avicenniae]QSX32306.1 hypothetical protein JYB87_11020 [Shewanella avicenniae]
MTDVIQTARATIQRGAAHADGQLTLTATELCFAPYNQQFGLGPYRIARNTIDRIEASSAKAAGILPISTDAIRIRLQDGQVYELILANTAQWINALRH